MKFSKVKIISALTVLSFSVFSLNAESEDSFTITSSAETDSGEISVIEEYAGSVSETELLTDEGIELSEAESVPAKTVENEDAVLSATEAVASVADENTGEVLPASEAADTLADAESAEEALPAPETALSAPAGADNSIQLSETAEAVSEKEALPRTEEAETGNVAAVKPDASEDNADEVLTAAAETEIIAEENMGEVLPATETAEVLATEILSVPAETGTVAGKPADETAEALVTAEEGAATDLSETAGESEETERQAQIVFQGPEGDPAENPENPSEAEIPEEPVFSALLDPYSEIYEPYSETTEQEEEETAEEPELPPEPPVPNSVMTFFSNEDFSVTLTGRGWVFLGDENNSQSVNFSGRQVSSTKTTFDFFAKNAGTALLKFWRQDSAKKKDVFNYIEVKVLEDPNFYDDWSTDTYFSGFYEEPDVIMFSDDFGFFGDYEDMDYEYEAELADKLRTAFEEEKYEAAISFADEYLESFFEYDEILFIKARSLEEKTKSRNIRTAYNLYRKITEEYPESDFWQEANNRAVYLERFYFSIR